MSDLYDLYGLAAHQSFWDKARKNMGILTKKTSFLWNPWASTTIKIMVDPIWMIETLREIMVVIFFHPLF